MSVRSPQPTVMKTMSTLQRSSAAPLAKLGAHASLYTPDGKARVFSLAPGGAIAELVPHPLRERRRQWAIVASGGAKSALVIARDDHCVDLPA